MLCADLFCWNIFIGFDTKLYRQVEGIPISTYGAPLVADLFLFCYETDFIMPLSDACNNTSRHLDNILNIQHIYFDNIVVKYNLQSFNLAQKILLILKPR